MGGVRTRFAPSPTGYMHVGGMRTALYAYLIAKKAGGTFILRIEDTDQGRFVEGATEVIIRSLRDAGLNYDEGPYIQSQRREIYAEYAEKLIALGGAYRDDAVVRQRVPKDGSTTFRDELFGDITVENSELDESVLIKSDGMPTYNFAHVVDDHLMGITHVVRGTEFLVSTPKYVLLYKAFGWEPPTYIHVAPVMKDAQHKLSKRNGDPTYEDLLNMGFLKEAVLNYVALLGWSPGGEREIFSLKELEQAFGIGGLSKSPAIFDLEKLTWLNGEYIKALPPERFMELVTLPPVEDGALLVSLLQPRCERLTDVAELTDFLVKLPDYDLSLFTHKKMKTDESIAKRVLTVVREHLKPLSAWNLEAIQDAAAAVVDRLALKNGQVLYPLRVAVSGKASTPGGGAEICVLLGKDESLRRIDAAIARL
ncbi:glutamate--tRNA ligase [Clostridia bacterium]|nr:glutamate--tRNA ligase [Clostridia bacterium]